LTCDVQSGQCVDPSAPGCDADADCEGGQVCDLASGACVDAVKMLTRAKQHDMTAELCEALGGPLP
jgi:hypothetical protein